MKEILSPEALTYSATTRCTCGAGVAFATSEDGREGRGCAQYPWWDCADVWLGIAEEFDSITGKTLLHCRKLNFYEYDIEIEKKNKKGVVVKTTRPGLN